MIYISSTPTMGFGVFTDEAIEEGTIIETAPVIIMSREDRILLDQTPLHDYIFEWGDNAEECVVALGFASIYNHSYQSNCEYQMEYGTRLMYIKTMRDIEAGEELFINYNGQWNNETPLWFNAH